MATSGSGASTKRQHKLALVIGIGEYTNINQLHNPENDAEGIKFALESIGFTVTMKLHLTCVEMQYALTDFQHSIQPGDMILFYFAGHGIQWEDQNYLLPKDICFTPDTNLNRSAIKAQEILNKLTDCNPFVTVFLLDCCRTYHLRNPSLDARSPNSSHSEPDEFKPMHKAGSLIAFACAPGTIAIEGHGQQNGLFTKHLLQHITTPNEDIQLMLRDVRRGVVKESNSRQIPFLSDGLLEKNICLYGQSKYKLPHLIQISDNDLKCHEEIGSGAFGIVYRATWLSTHYTVAVKKLHLTNLTNDFQKAFLQELSLLHNLRGPHIISFLGACMEIGKYALVMEYMSLGSLYKILHVDKLQLTWAERLSIALQAAEGINYLHQLPVPILHRDIKSLNFLLERTYEGYAVKVCDFGVARTRNETTRLTKPNLTLPITLPWTAPEILQLRAYTKKSDIYSLGIVYWELATCKIPYEGYAGDVIREFVLAGNRLDISEDTPSTFRTVIEQCWANNPMDRPNGSELIQMIEQCGAHEPMDRPNDSKLIQMIEQCIRVGANQKCDSHRPLTCHGRQCVTCGRCSDWEYTGKPEDWQWIRHVRSWNHQETERWSKGTYYSQFKLRNGATCDRSILYSASYIARLLSAGAFNGSKLLGHLCVCDSEAVKVK